MNTDESTSWIIVDWHYNLFPTQSHVHVYSSGHTSETKTVYTYPVYIQFCHITHFYSNFQVVSILFKNKKKLNRIQFSNNFFKLIWRSNFI